MKKYKKFPLAIKLTPEVWLSYRSKGTDTLHKLLLPVKDAQRYYRKLYRANRCDIIQLQGTLDIEPIKKITKQQQVAEQVKKEDRQIYLDRLQDYRLVPERRRNNWRVTNSLSFHAQELDNAVIVFCPVTGICGRMEFPSLPINLSYDHPLAKAGNCLSVIRAIKKQRESEYPDRQIMAGMTISLLRAKGLIKLDDESTAVEHNAVLQGSGQKRLIELLWLMEYHWDNPQVWKRMPALSVSYRAHKLFPGTIGEAVQNYTKILKDILDPTELTQEEQAKIFAAQRARSNTSPFKNRIKVHSAAAVEERNIKDSKEEIRDLFEHLKVSLSIVQRVQITNTIRNLLILPQSAKLQAASILRNAFIGKPQAEPAKKLATLIENSKNEELLSDIGSFIQEVSPVRIKSIAEIREEKKGQRGE